MKKRYIVILIIALVVIILLAWFFMKPKSDTNSSSAPEVNITYQNIASVIGKSSMVSSLPSNSDLLLKFYSFNSGVRVWEKFFTIQKGLMKETTNPDEEAEIVLTLNSKYLHGLTNHNFCSMIQQANQNGDLGFETEMSAAALAWKFKSMYQYKDCFGY